MPKGSFWSDTFEQLAELGKSTAKQSVQAVKQTFDPLKMMEKTVNPNAKNDKGIEQLEKGKGEKQSHTPLDFNKLENQYQNQDKMKADALRNRLFQLVKSEDKKILQEKKQEELQKKRQEEYEKQEKKRRQQQQAMQQPADIPHGKERKSIFSHKKVAQREKTEVKPASGKQ